MKISEYMEATAAPEGPAPAGMSPARCQVTYIQERLRADIEIRIRALYASLEHRPSLDAVLRAVEGQGSGGGRC